MCWRFRQAFSANSAGLRRIPRNPNAIATRR